MSVKDKKIRNIQRLIAGMAFLFVVSFATAAMMVLLPGESAPGHDVAPDTGSHATSEYVQLHQARHTTVPSYMVIDVATTTH